MFAIVPFFILGLILQSRFIRKILHKLSEKFENYIVPQQEIYSLVNSIKEIKIFFKKEKSFRPKIEKNSE